MTIVMKTEKPPLSSKQAPKWQYETEAGATHPLGATPDKDGVNFSMFSRAATAVQLLLFDEHDDREPAQVIHLDPVVNKTFYLWHVYVKGLQPGAHYAYRVDGPKDLHGQGHRYNVNKVLIDPYARGNTATLWDRGKACGLEDNLATSMRSVVIDITDYDWEGDQPIIRKMNDTIFYELHVGGFTRHPSSGVDHPGTFKGLIEKIPYLKELGITTVELLPVLEFDNKEGFRPGPDGRPLGNYWGYSTIGFFSPESSYCVHPEVGNHVREFRDLVKALHKAGIGVVLDVVFNHTSEGNHLGPTISFKGFANEIFYHLVPGDKQYYMDYSGCGNTVNCNHPLVNKFIVQCLEFWVREMHVDGFRFDEGSILARGEDGAPMVHPPVVWNIELSDILRGTRIVAEAWDAGGLYQIGFFPGYRWGEWNGRFRDDVRRFVKGDAGMLGAVASRIAGSEDLYHASGHLPLNTVNFVTCHDGFTLNDLVSYNEKHNEANGEGNRDGINDNLSWNCGVEGETDDPTIESLRERQIKNFATILMLSQGPPLFVAGDEVRRTQKGNNNAYCQDNEISWFNWDLVNKHKDLLRFWKGIIHFRRRHACLRRAQFFTGAVDHRGIADITWHGTRLNSPGWDDPNARTLAFTLAGVQGGEDIHVMLNMYWDRLDFDIPLIPGRDWYLAVNTAAPSPGDIAELGTEPLIEPLPTPVEGRSIMVMIAR